MAKTKITTAAKKKRKKSADAQTKYKGFTVEHSGKPNCYFVITNEELRQELASLDMFSISIQNILTLVNVLSLLDDPDSDFGDSTDDESGMLASFIAAVKEERALLAAHNAAVKARGSLSFEELLTVFDKDEEIVVAEGGVRHGAKFLRTVKHETMFGPVAEVKFKFVSYNGDKYVYCEESRIVRGFSGRATITSFGIDLMTPEERTILAARGRRFIELNNNRTHGEYAGNVARRGWIGNQYYRADGRMIVDVKSFRKMDPNYGDFYGGMSGDNDFDDDGAIADVQDDSVLACCTPFVYGFSFAAKVWGEFLIDSVSPARYRLDAFDRVVLEPERKRLIKALVSSELGKFSDIVDGKGAGCIFLLAGKPGVGKTVTAEAIAETQKKPLYIVGAGELGVTPGEVEEKLREVLEVASIWNAVLLIDECDIFLERRTTNDIQRNAIVAIFLRMLEYYPGLLFLTTNRVKELDEAFLSRISVALFYKKLGFKKRKKIWKGLAENHGFESLKFKKLAKHDLNGREIKTALRIALALAHSEQRKPGMSDIEHVIDFGDQFRAVGVKSGKKKRR